MAQMRSLSYLVFLIIAANLSIVAYATLNTEVCRIASFFSEYLTKDQKVEVQFFNYTREHSNVTSLKFDPNKRTTIIVHGFLSSHNADWVRTLTQKLLKLEDMNVIAVDWSNVFLKDSFFHYKGAAKKSTLIAEKIYNFLIEWAKYKSGCSKTIWPYLHFIGHSLGAHIVGQVAKKLKPHVYVNRVTGLDPAKPYFDEAGTHLRLDKSCAQFVDVIHTNSDPNADTFGMHEPLGHIDFYPNGGDKQCPCSSIGPMSIPAKDSEFVKCFSQLFLGMDLSKLYDNVLSRFETGHNMICDHKVCPDYFTDSILSENPLLAYKVDFPINKRKNTCGGYKSRVKGTWIEMGMNAYLYNSSRYHGTYYVDTPCSTLMEGEQKYFIYNVL